MGYQGKDFGKKMSQFARRLEIVKRARKYFRVPAEVEDITSYLSEKGIDVSDGFKILPKRWIVERTFAWFGKYRRLSKDYEYQCDSSKTMLFIAMIRNTLKRIRKTQN